MSRALSHVPDEAWERLQAEFPESQPACPDCGAAWDLDSASEVDGETYDGKVVVSSATVCSRWDEDEGARREPAPHPISGRMGEHELTLA
jgi:hypothetical protein